MSTSTASRMADTGAVASITGVASEAFRLSLVLNAVSCEVANAGLEVHSISKSVTLFAMMLKQTGNVLRSADPVHSHEAVETAESIAEESTRVFDEINDMLDRLRTKQVHGNSVPTIQQRFRWCFRKHRVTYLMAQLENLKLSLILMLQIIELGRLMASTSRHDRPEEVAVKTEAIRQERAEAQNAVIVRYWQMSKMDRLFEASQKEEEDDRKAHTGADTPEDDDLSLAETNSPQQTTDVPPPEYAPSSALVKLPVYSLGELDQTLHQIKDSPRDMIQVSDRAIDPLLERWTIWRQVRERRHERGSGGRFVPTVQQLDEDDDDRPLYERFGDQEDSPRGYYLEGSTTDWRRPNSAAARQEASRRRREYSNYQPSVTTATSDVDEETPGTNAFKKRAATRHVIESDSESSDSEPDQLQSQPRRRGSDGPVNERKVSFQEGHSASHTHAVPIPPTGRAAVNGAGGGNRAPSITAAPPVAPRLTSPAHQPPNHRPWPTPDQNPIHHSISSPFPPVHPGIASNPYVPPPPPPPQQHYPGYPRYTGPPAPQLSTAYGVQPGSPSRYMPPATNPIVFSPRPGSQDGKHGRSPSRLSQHSTPARGHARADDDKRHSREKSTKHNLREGATKGLLGAGAMAGFLQALEGLSI
ncbi:hypothetical protein ABEF93_000153 [Exophiala dermatitidis]